MTPDEFVLARIDEDEARVNAAKWSPPIYSLADSAFDEAIYLAEMEGAKPEAIDFVRATSPDRVLADCAAKRDVVKIARRMANTPPTFNPTPQTGRAILGKLAAAWSHHSDYDPEWANYGDE